MEQASDHGKQMVRKLTNRVAARVGRSVMVAGIWPGTPETVFQNHEFDGSDPAGESDWGQWCQEPAGSVWVALAGFGQNWHPMAYWQALDALCRLVLTHGGPSRARESLSAFTRRWNRLGPARPMPAVRPDLGQWLLSTQSGRSVQYSIRPCETRLPTPRHCAKLVLRKSLRVAALPSS